MAQKFELPLKRSPRSDPQQYRVYRMEAEAIGARSYYRMTRAAQRSLAASICRTYGVRPVKLVWKDLGRWAAQWVAPGTVYLNTRKGTAKDFLTVTHELAHHLHYWLSGGAAEKHQSHGPEFMGIHMSVLDVCRAIPVVGMRAVCERWGVRYVDPGTKNSLKRLRAIARGRP